MKREKTNMKLRGRTYICLQRWNLLNEILFPTQYAKKEMPEKICLTLGGFL